MTMFSFYFIPSLRDLINNKSVSTIITAFQALNPIHHRADENYYNII